jgi:hypothetical protein
VFQKSKVVPGTPASHARGSVNEASTVTGRWQDADGVGIEVYRCLMIFFVAMGRRCWVGGVAV